MTPLRSYASSEFWSQYRRLPVNVQRLADKQFSRFLQDPSHSSLHLKPVGDFWSARVTEAYRALAVRDGNDFYWFWIGSHDEYERLISA